MRGILLATLLLWQQAAHAQDFAAFMKKFATSYRALNIPGLTLGYREYFEQIADSANLKSQEVFFKQIMTQLPVYKKLTRQDALYQKHIAYETENNLQRIALELKWVADGRPIPQGGLYHLAQRKDWYIFFIKRFTSIDITPEEVYRLGIVETERVKKEIAALQQKTGFADTKLFYKHLQQDGFYLHDKEDILNVYNAIDSTVRHNLKAFINTAPLPPIDAMEWPGADGNTPPGIYLSRDYNSYGKDVFQFNFWGRKHSKRSMEWLYMHEAVPGHHLQSVVRRNIQAPDFQSEFSYPGNFEGWACYVEYYGKSIGLYQDIYSELGKWEWDLVRSVRLVLDVGIHYYGWNREKAMQYWKENIHGQDNIADREITRITNWPGQALSYKVGAYKIEQAKKIASVHGLTQQEFHRNFLEMSYFPLQIAMDHFYTMK